MAEAKPEGKGKGAFTDKGVQKNQEDRIAALEAVVFGGATPESVGVRSVSFVEPEEDK